LRRAPAVLAPVAPGRFKVQFTASQALRDKLVRLRALARAQVPGGELGDVVELAVDAYLAKLEARRFGKTDAPRTSVGEVDTAPRSRHIPAAVRRAVVARDGNRCTFVSDDGHRCSATDDLQCDHVQPWARGGGHLVENLTLRCGPHNRYRGRLAFGDRAREGGARYSPGAPRSAIRDSAELFANERSRRVALPFEAPHGGACSHEKCSRRSCRRRCPRHTRGGARAHSAAEATAAGLADVRQSYFVVPSSAPSTPSAAWHPPRRPRCDEWSAPGGRDFAARPRTSGSSLAANLSSGHQRGMASAPTLGAAYTSSRRRS
jgi:hypothetical protein